jgi:hypothetical protein
MAEARDSTPAHPPPRPDLVRYASFLVGPSDAHIVSIAVSDAAARLDDVDNVRPYLTRAVTMRLASGVQCAR